VTDGQDGLLVRPKDPRALAEAMSRIIDDAALRKHLIQQGRERVAGLTVERFVDLVLKLLANRPPAAVRESGIEIAADEKVATRSH
jgi:glycosyltransferase involved in cell wall biosynthesis